MAHATIASPLWRMLGWYMSSMAHSSMPQFRRGAVPACRTFAMTVWRMHLVYIIVYTSMMCKQSTTTVLYCVYTLVFGHKVELNKRRAIAKVIVKH